MLQVHEDNINYQKKHGYNYKKQMTKEHITKREIFERVRDIRTKILGDVKGDMREALIELETSVLTDCRNPRNICKKTK